MFDLKNIPLPKYSRAEDIANCITHALGIPFCIVAAVLLIRLHVIASTGTIVLVSIILYVLSTLIVYVGSAVYHGLKPSRAKQIARVIDHSNIFFMIAGTVTSFALPTMTNENKTYTIVMICVIWGFSLVGVLLTFMDFKKFAVPQVFMYVILGWAAIFCMRSVYRMGDIGKKFTVMVLIGGVCITVGTVLYLIGKKHKYFHAVFHTCVFAGSVVIFSGVYNFYSSLFLG